MGKIIKDTIHANGIDIGIYTQDFENEFISLTDIARYKSDDPTAVIQNWMRNRDVIEFLGLWERLHNPDFKPLEFERFKKQSGANAFNLNREISKLNYRIHTDAIRDNLIPPELTPAHNEADMLNVVLFGKTAKQWKDENSSIRF